MKLRMLVYGCCLVVLLGIPLLTRRSRPASEGYMAALQTDEAGTLNQGSGENAELAAYRAYFAARRHDDHVLSRKIDRLLRLYEKGR